MNDPNTINNITTADEDVMIPEGWGENDDIFADPNTWTGASPADEPAAAQEPSEGEAAGDTDGEPAPTPGQEPEGDAAGEGAEPAPTPEQDGDPAPNKKLKFKARIDREDRDVEMDESELPNVYQKAQNHDRMQGKVAQLQPIVDDFENMARSLGHENARAMLDKFKANYIDGEVRRLVGDGVHEEVARDMVQRRMEAAQQDQHREQAQAPTRAEGLRDFKAETQELLQARPELQGKALPDEVVKACVHKGKNLLVAYAEYETQQERAEAESLRQKIRILEQNQASAAKGPVKGTGGGGPTDTKAGDPFLQGLNSDY